METTWNFEEQTSFLGFASTLANVSQVIPQLQQIPLVVLKVFPYVVTLIALIIFSKSSLAPKAAGEPFDAGKEIDNKKITLKFHYFKSDLLL